MKFKVEGRKAKPWTNRMISEKDLLVASKRSIRARQRCITTIDACRWVNISVVPKKYKSALIEIANIYAN